MSELLGDILRKTNGGIEKAQCVIDDFFELHKKEFVKLAEHEETSYKVMDATELHNLFWAFHKMKFQDFETYVIEKYGLNTEIFQGGIGRDYLDKITFSWEKPASIDNCSYLAEK